MGIILLNVSHLRELKNTQNKNPLKRVLRAVYMLGLSQLGPSVLVYYHLFGVDNLNLSKEKSERRLLSYYPKMDRPNCSVLTS